MIAESEWVPGGLLSSSFYFCKYLKIFIVKKKERKKTSKTKPKQKEASSGNQAECSWAGCGFQLWAELSGPEEVTLETPPGVRHSAVHSASHFLPRAGWYHSHVLEVKTGTPSLHRRNGRSGRTGLWSPAVFTKGYLSCENKDSSSGDQQTVI